MAAPGSQRRLRAMPDSPGPATEMHAAHSKLNTPTPSPRSHWRSRAVPDPWGGAGPATETVLLHHEQFKIPERLARFAVLHGMWSFVRKVGAQAVHCGHH